MKSYNLSAYSTIEYCAKNNKDQELGMLHRFGFSFTLDKNCFCTDILEIFTAGVIISILLFVFLSSLYDRYLRSFTVNKANHYKVQLELKVQRILTLFSIRRNWNTLSAPTKDDVRDLRFIEAIRALMMFGVIHNHCAMYSIILPSANPIFIDDVSDKR